MIDLKKLSMPGSDENVSVLLPVPAPCSRWVGLRVVWFLPWCITHRARPTEGSERYITRMDTIQRCYFKFGCAEHYLGTA